MQDGLPDAAGVPPGAVGPFVVFFLPLLLSKSCSSAFPLGAKCHGQSSSTAATGVLGCSVSWHCEPCRTAVAEVPAVFLQQ